ncbi:hypothetical protein WR25_11085 [Diploscapter pachys]|uniref:Uncharacterized protein n=1 Tax=Diploscapter pachys TaxID=2018661 RepID=A0A2A2K8N2_9BILA|nr:hypothetical protein WR25_11085 [Diploscapter pachys]
MYGITPSAISDMRLSEPPEKVLKKSSTPPVVRWLSRPNAVGSMPGSGTSVACANFARLMLCAIWSAADAMRVGVLKRKRRVSVCPPPPLI